MNTNKTYRVLSIQSHVVHGYAGNKSITFPLQLLGYEVDAINSVQFSNHTAYKYHSGQILNSDELWDVYDGLKKNNILNKYTHLLTGYIGSTSFLNKVKEIIQDLKSINPNLIYVCDPVMGDNGKMYVDPLLLPIYRKEIIPLADIITPNQFETELLADMSIKSERDATDAITRLMNLGPKTVVISSAVVADDLVNDELSIFAGSEVSKIDCYFVGSGDLFTCLMMAWLNVHPNDLKLACIKSLSSVQHILNDTKLKSTGNKDDCREHELRIIQNRVCIENPEINIQVHDIIS